MTERELAKRVSPTNVRYIKLGAGGRWLKECLRDDIIRFGFGTGAARKFKLCAQRNWPALIEDFLAEGRSQGAATNTVNQTKAFFEDDGSTLWITFDGPQLHWAMLKDNGAEPHESGDGVFRRVRGA